MIKIFKSVFLFAILVMQIGCSSDKESVDPNPERTVLVYIAANNNLSGFAYENIQDMIKGAADCNLKYDNLIVYASISGDIPHLYRIDKDGMHLIKDYPMQNSLDKNVMANVLSEVRALYPAPSNGVIFWSHGYGWMPPSIFATRFVSENSSPHPLTKNFGADNMSSVGISAEEIAELLPDNTYDFIAFDACYMGAIEVVWALRKKCDYMLLSAAEVLAEGLPYKLIVSDLFAEGQADLKNIAKKYYETYNSRSTAYERSATTAVVDCKHVENLAAEFKNIVTQNENNPINAKEIQWFDRTVYGRHFAYDFGDYVNHMTDLSSSAKFYDELNKTVIARYATQTLWSGDYLSRDVIIRKFSGLTIFIPTNQESDNVMSVYKETDWYKYIYMK